ncbi:hypothetical protein B566_EDAN001293 [Ephemera danica]|nr:hypothetical protein B566_EDAN001293 [Ephemera danica]
MVKIFARFHPPYCKRVKPKTYKTQNHRRIMSVSGDEQVDIAKEDHSTDEGDKVDTSVEESPKSGEKLTPEKEEKDDEEKSDSEVKQKTPKKKAESEKPKTPKSGQKQRKPKEESSEEEEDDDDEDDDGKVPLLDQPLQVAGRRDRKKTQRFTEELDKSLEVRSPVVQTVPQGEGTPLGEIPHIEANIKKADKDVLKLLHRVMYGRVGKATTIRKFIRQFNGFDLKEKSELQKKQVILAKSDTKHLRDICKLLCIINAGSTREAKATSVMNFLKKPENMKPEKGPKEKKAKGSKSKTKTPNKKKGGSGTDDESNDSDDASDAEEEKKKAKKPARTLAKKGKTPAKLKKKVELSDSENEDGSDASSVEPPVKKQKKTPAKKLAVKIKPKKKVAKSESDDDSEAEESKKSKKSAPVRSAREKSKKNDKDDDLSGSEKKEDSESDSEHEPLVKKVEGPPDDEAIKAYIKEILKGANLEEITMKTVCKQVYENYPKFDLSHKKDFIKTTVKSALLSPGIVNFTSTDEEEKQAKDTTPLNIVNIKNLNNPLPPMSELQRPGGLPTSTITISTENEEQLMSQSLEGRNQSAEGSTSGTLDTSLLDLHNEETFNGALSQFPCTVSYKLTTSSELLTTHAGMEPLPPISEVHKAAAGQLLRSSASSRDQLLSSGDRSKDMSSYPPSSSPLPNDMAGSLLLSSARGPLPAMSSSQVSSLLSALNSDLSNSEPTGKELSSLNEIELSPSRKLAEQLGLGTSSKIPVLQLHLNPTTSKISSLIQTDQVDEVDGMITLTPTTTSSSKVVSRVRGKNRITLSKAASVCTTTITNVGPTLLIEQPIKVIKVKRERSASKAVKKGKPVEPKNARKKNTPIAIEKKPQMERVACFKCSFCPFLSLDKDGVDAHIAEEHKPPSEKSPHHTETVTQELQCPGCPNVFYSAQSLKVHLCQDHRVSEVDVQQIVDCLCPTVSVETVESVENVKTEKQTGKKYKALEPQPSVEVYTDEQGKIHVRTGTSIEASEDFTNQRSPSHSTPLPDVYTDEQGKIHISTEPTSPAMDSSAADVTFNSGDEAAINSEKDNGMPPSEAKSDEPVVKRRGRPRGSRNIGITALRRQNPSLRLGEKELGYCCALNGCAVRLRSHDNIEYHRRCHSKGSMFVCPECRHTFTQWRVLTAHLWRAHVIHNTDVKQRPLKSGECDVCFRHFADKRLLRLHKDTVHEKIRPFLCNYCGYSASSRSTLKMHMRQHTGEKPFACSECEYRTADHNSLRRHRMRHSGQKQYQCPHCAYACIQSSTYKTHLRNKHPGLDDGLLFCCPHCPFRTIKKENQVAHLAEHQTGSSASSSLTQTSTTASIDEVSAKRSKRNVQSNTGKPKSKNDVTPKNKAAENLLLNTKNKSKITLSTPTLEPTMTMSNSKKKEQAQGKKKGKTKNARSTQTIDETGNAVGTSADDEGRYPVLASQLKIAAQLGELGDEVPVLSVMDSNKLLQLSASDLVPLGLTAAQASALQLALAGGEPEQIPGTEITNSIVTVVRKYTSFLCPEHAL